MIHGTAPIAIQIIVAPINTICNAGFDMRYATVTKTKIAALQKPLQTHAVLVEILDCLSMIAAP